MHYYQLEELLLEAAENRNYQKITELVSLGIDINTTEAAVKYEIIKNACEEDDFEYLRYLVSIGAETFEAMRATAKRGAFKEIKYLNRMGLDMSKYYLVSGMEGCVENGHTEILNYLKNMVLDYVTPFRLEVANVAALQYGQLDIAKTIIGLGAWKDYYQERQWNHDINLLLDKVSDLRKITIKEVIQKRDLGMIREQAEYLPFRFDEETVLMIYKADWSEGLKELEKAGIKLAAYNESILDIPEMAVFIDYQQLLNKSTSDGNMDKIQLSENRGGDLRFDDDFPLVLSAKNGHLEVVKYLVSRGADVCSGWNSPLLWSARNGHLEIVEYLVSKGADVTAEGNLAVKWASKYGHLQVVKFLKEQGADIHADNDLAYCWSLLENRQNVADYLAGNGAEYSDSYLDFALIMFAEMGSLAGVRLVVRNGADVHLNDDKALKTSSYNGHYQVVEYLLEMGADIHVDSEYPLVNSAARGHLDIVKLLSSKGADIHHANDLALRNCVAEKHFDVMTYLISKGCNVNASSRILEQCALFSDLETLKFLVDNGVDVTADECCAFRSAASNGALENAKYLFSKGARIEASDYDAIVRSARNGKTEVLKFLLSKVEVQDISANAKTKALIGADNYEIAEIMANCGAVLPYDYESDITYRSSIEPVKIYISMGADRLNGFVENEVGSGRLDMVKHLYRKGFIHEKLDDYVDLCLQKSQNSDLAKYLVLVGADTGKISGDSIDTMVFRGRKVMGEYLLSLGIWSDEMCEQFNFKDYSDTYLAVYRRDILTHREIPILKIIEDKDFSLLECTVKTLPYKIDEEALVVMVNNKWTDGLKLLADKGFKLKSVSTRSLDITELVLLIDYTSMLLEASRAGNADLVKIALKRGGNIHFEDDLALTFAAMEGHLDVVKILVENGADIAAEDTNCLCWSAKNGHLDVVKYLIDNGANVHDYRDFAVKWSSKTGKADVVQCLVEAGADYHLDDSIAIKWSLKEGHTEVIEYYRSLGVDINKILKEEQDKMLLNGVNEENMEEVRSAIAKGADIHIKDSNILAKCSSEGSMELVECLVDNGADGNNDKAFLEAVKGNYLDIVKYLSSKGAGSSYEVWMEAMKECWSDEVRKFLVAKGCGVEDIYNRTNK